jgi:hypothetical protein
MLRDYIALPLVRIAYTLPTEAFTVLLSILKALNLPPYKAPLPCSQRFRASNTTCFSSNLVAGPAEPSQIPVAPVSTAVLVSPLKPAPPSVQSINHGLSCGIYSI